MAVRTSEQLSASLEDYLEAICNLSADQGVARSKDIADSMGVSRASVTAAMKTLSEKGLVHYKPYGYTTLTEKGCVIARRIVRRHDVLARFFEHVIGADAAAAQAAACKAEHSLGPELTARMMAFIEFVSQQQDNGSDIARQFQDYWNSQSEI